MKRLLLLLASVLCCATWMVAQSNSGQNSSANQAGSSEAASSQSGSNSGAANGDVRVTGCLRQANGQFQITDVETGTSYSLMGKRDLSRYVGDDVEVMGMPTGTSGNTASSANEEHNLGKSANENPFQVHSIKQRGECREKQQ